MGLPGEQRVARAPFPLTPSLSLGEREQHLPRWLQAHGAGCANQRSKMVHPLPKGEGWGEGEGSARNPLFPGQTHALQNHHVPATFMDSKREIPFSAKPLDSRRWAQLGTRAIFWSAAVSAGPAAAMLPSPWDLNSQ